MLGIVWNKGEMLLLNCKNVRDRNISLFSIIFYLEESSKKGIIIKCLYE